MRAWFRLNRYDVFTMAVSYPAMLLGTYFVLGPTYFEQLNVFVPVTLGESVLYVLFAWMMASWMKYMRYRYTEVNQSVRRILYCLVFDILITVLFVCLIYGLLAWFEAPGFRFDPLVFRWSLLLGLTSNIVSVGIMEAIYSYEKWKASVEREFRLNQLHMQQQLDSLKQQVNPHFLFNSLNSLTALIGENPQQAEVFAEELSSVYRYVLRANEQNLTDLDTELEFIQSYYHLLKTRYGTGLSLEVTVDRQFGQYQLPPLTLQLLLENAVKHNVVLAEQPLKIAIQTDDAAFISVRNTLQKKKSRVLSNGVGLSNILTKYRMMGQDTPTIQEQDGHFVVKLPLIKVTP